MATNKKTTFRDKSPKMDDFDLDMDDFDFQSPSQKKDASRKPIMKVAVNVGRGSLGHFTSESFVRNTIGKSLPAGYDTAIDTSYEISGAVGEAYNTAAQEWRKIAPSARRAVDRLMPRAQSILPKALANRLEKFAKGGSQESGNQSNPDEDNLRSVLAELEQTTQLQKQKERAESNAKDELKGQIDTRRFNSSIKVMASMDARLAHIQAFNDQAFARFQRRSLEIQYRSYFVQRDLLKLQGNEMAAQRQLLQAVVHNTALPDMVKAKAREKYGEGLRERLMSGSQQAIVDYTRGFAGRIKERVKGSIQNVGNGLAMGVQGLQMGQEMVDMQREMGGDMAAESAKALGAMLGSVVSKFVAGSVGQGFRRSGAVAQGGAKLNRLFKDLPIKVGKWSSTNTDYGDSLFSNLKGSLAQMAKDHVGGQFRPDKRVRTSGVLDAGDPGMYSKRTQRSIEEIIPGYLSHILHELTMTRTGNAGVDRMVWNDDKSKFTTHKQQGKDAMDRVFNNPNMKYARSSTSDLADEITAGSVLSPKAKNELMQDLLLKVMHGDTMDPLDYVRGGGKGTTLSKETQDELRKALKGRLKGSNGKLDEVTRHHLSARFGNLRETAPDIRGMLSGYAELGAGDHFEAAGITSADGSDTVMNYERIARMMAGDREASPTEPRYNRDTPEYAFGGSNPFLKAMDRTIDLRKVADGPIIVSAKKVAAGSYRNATTGDPIHLMHDVLLGVKEAGKLVVTPDQAAKLRTPTGETFGEWALRNKRPVMSTGKLSKAYQRAVDKLAKVGGKIDDKLEQAQQSKFWKRAKSKRYRQEKKDQAHAWAETKTQGASDWAGGKAANAADSIMAAAEASVTPGTETNASLRAGVNTVQSVATEQFASLKAKAAPLVNPWIAKLKKKWRRAMAVKRFGMSLYRKGELKPLIDAEALKAGAYISAKTNLAITDMRDLVDGVKTKDGTWVASAEQVVTELRAKSGEKFTDLMEKAQAIEEQVKATPAYQSAAAQATSVSQRLTSTAAGVQAKVAAAATKAQASASAAADNLGLSVRPADAMEPLLDTLTAFKDGNLERLESILEAVMAGGGGSPASIGSAGKRSWLGRAIRAPGKALAWGAKKYGKYVGAVGRGFGHVFSGAFSLAGKATRGIFGKRDALGNEAADVYVKGDKVARLTAGAMEAGEYFNANGSPIHVPADIKGPVYNADKTKTYLSAADFKKGLTDGTGRSLIGSVIRGVGGALGTAAGWLGGYYGLVARGAGWALGKGRDLIKSIFSRDSLPVDVYVKGDLTTPRLFATGMKAGSYVLVKNPRKKVRSVQDIDGAVRDITDKANIVLSDEDLAKGIVDVRGKPFKVKRSLAGKLADGVGSVASGYLKLLGSMARGGAALASAPFKLLGWMFGGGKGKLGKDGKHGVPTADERTHALLTEVLHLLDARMPENEHYRAGSWQEKMAARKGAKTGVGADGKPNAKNGLWGKLKGLFSQNTDEDEDEESDGDTYIDADGNRVPKPKKGTFSRNMKARGKGLLRKLKRTKAGKLAGRLGSRVAKSGVGRLAGRIASSTGGRVAGRVLGGGGRVLAGAGRVALGAGRLGLSLVGMGSMGGALTTVGSGIATAAGGVASAAGAVGSGLMAAGSTILGALSLPVVLTAAAVAAVGVGAYYGYKYYELKKKAPLRKLRMAQYGVDMNKEVMPVGKIQKLEELLLPHVTVSKSGQAVVTMPADAEEEILKIFGLKKSAWNPTGWFHSKDAQDEADQKNFKIWLMGRFKPVFLNWVSSVHQINPKMSLSDCDSELKPDQKRALLKAVYAQDASVYGVMASPFGTDPLTAGKAQVDSAYAEALKDLPEPKDAKSGGSATKAAGTAAAAAAAKVGTGAKPGGTGTGGGKADAIGTAASAAAAMAATGAKGATKSKPVALTAAGIAPKGQEFLGGTISALRAIRYKTYGVSVMVPEQVKAFYLLEDEVSRNFVYDAKGTAKFMGDASYFYKAYMGYFGLSPTDEAGRLRWYSWFSKRFIPTLLAYAGAIRSKDKSVDLQDVEKRLSASQILDVANQTVAAAYVGDGGSASVWGFLDSPFGIVPLNPDSVVTKGNLEALQQNVKKAVLKEQTAKKTTSTRNRIEAAADEATKAAADAGGKEQAKAGFWGKVKNFFTGKSSGMNPEEASTKGYVKYGKPGASMGQIVPQPGNGTAGDVNKLPMPTGDGQQAMKALLEAVGAMTGVSPQTLNTFAGIESTWRAGIGAGTSSAAGLFQFIDSTWKSMLSKYGKKYGLDTNASKTDPRANALMGAEYLKENQRSLAGFLGHAPTDTDLYMAHFLGVGGAKQFLSASGDSIAAAVMPSAASANKSIFYNNGRSLTKAEVVAALDKKVSHFRAMGEGMEPDKELAAAPTGGNTTTTANGPTGGVGAKAAFSGVSSAVTSTPSANGAKALAAIAPPGSARVPTPTGGSGSAPDPVVAVQAANQQRAMAADRQAQSTMEAQQAQMGDLSQYLKNQTALQQQMVALLEGIHGHTGNLPTIAAHGAGGSGGEVGKPPSAQTAGTPRPTPPSAGLPKAPVSVQRKSYA